jgi:hypothetical protein
LPAGTGRWPRLPNNGGDERSHSFSHHRSITADLEASLGGGRRKTALRVASCRLECWQRGLLFLHTWSCCISAGRHSPVVSAARERAATAAAGIKLPSRLSAAASSAGGATPSTPPAPAVGAPAVFFHWQTSPVFPALSPALRGCGEPFKGPATDISRSRAPFGDQGPAHRLSFPQAGHRKAGGGESGVRSSRAGQDHQAVEQPLGLSPPHGEEAGWLVAVLRRLPPAQQRHRSGHLPTAEHDGFYLLGSQGAQFLQKLICEKDIIKFLCTLPTS